MARLPRPLLHNGIYHVMSRGNRREAVFGGDGDRSLFLQLVLQVARRRAWIVHAYCLMTTHYHLVVQTPRPDLHLGMQVLNGEYAQWFNRSHGLVGHVFRGRYKAILVESDWHLVELYRYLALNPVRAGQCETPSGWRWSSYTQIVRGEDSPLVSSARVLGFFGANRARAREQLRRFVEDGLAAPDGSSPAMSGSDPDMAALGAA